MTIQGYKINRKLENILKFLFLFRTIGNEYTSADYIKEKWDMYIGCDPLESDIYEITKKCQYQMDFYWFIKMIDITKVNSHFNNGLHENVYKHMINCINDAPESIIRLNREINLSNIL